MGLVAETRYPLVRTPRGAIANVDPALVAGAANNALEAIPDPADAPGTADALRDDLVANAIPAIRNNFADLTAKVNALLADQRAGGEIVP